LSYMLRACLWSKLTLSTAANASTGQTDEAHSLKVAYSQIPYEND